ncbi:hypothetical protein PHMEG_00015570 [Phytophthora megakarya]|uniref:Uncharacterized protein n=1 Tax=Phytophthora megakarya TaxID=4795 RepID=A0A225W1F0_9STRA|nr:hypothetical protein PHMEG_00015570 [Phytophthora megakarya]
MSTSLPLPKGFFNTNVHVSEDMRRQYIEFAEASIRKVFALSDCHKNSWIPMREKKGVAIYRNFGQMRGPKAYKSNIAEVGCKGQLAASLDQVGRAYAAHDDALFKRLMKKLNSAVMDAAVLFTIVPRTPLAPFRYIGIKWYAVKTPTPIVSHRDYCCLEVQDKIVDSFGNEMYIRILNSIEVNECPSLENSHGLVRAKILAGYMYRVDRAEPNVVRIHHVARFDPGGYFPAQWAFKTAESQLVSSIVQIRRIIDKQQMNACTFVDKRQWVPNHERLHCASVEVPGTTLKNIRICSVCNMGVQKAGGQDDGTMSDISTSSVTSSSTLAHNEMNLMDLYMTNAQRLSSYKQNPVDIGYLRDSVHEPPAPTAAEEHERPEDPTTPWPPAKMQRLETEETADVDMESDLEEMEAKPAVPIASQETQQRSLGMQLPTVERISESPFEQSSCSSSVLRASLDKEEAPTNSSGLRPFFSGILSRVRGESVEKSSQRAA